MARFIKRRRSFLAAGMQTSCFDCTIQLYSCLLLPVDVLLLASYEESYSHLLFLWGVGVRQGFQHIYVGMNLEHTVVDLLVDSHTHHLLVPNKFTLV